ncbi:MAG TPA: Ig-like domain-containing protein [Longimicrobium sp.]|nr:Ig-like domain-containing protein [Longimicrobium sp.]
MSRRFLPVLLAMGIAACGSDGGTNSDSDATAVFVGPESTTLAVGQETKLSVTVRDGANKLLPTDRVQWSTLDASVASVTTDGTVKALKVGATQIVARSGNLADSASIIVSGDVLRNFNANGNAACASPQTVTAKLVAQGTKVQIFEDRANPAGGFTTADYQQIAAAFDNQIWPVDTRAFGEPSDLDGNGRVVILYTRAVNALTPANVNYIVGGFFYSRDLFPKIATPTQGACAASNEAEMFYMLAPDPNGEVNGNRRTAESVRRSTLSTVAHEFQHLINASRRLFVVRAPGNQWNEEVWLNEGLSHIAEELNYYAGAGLGPRGNIGIAQITGSQGALDAFNMYGISNFGRVGEFYRNVSNESPIQSDDDLSTRGAAWSFLRYVADQRNGDERDVWFNLVNSANSGVNNVQTVLGIDVLARIRDWNVALYADDIGIPVAPKFTMPSWDMRSVLSNRAFGNGFPLATTQLVNATPVSVAMVGATSSYLRFGVAAGGTGDVRISSPGSPTTSACTTLNLAVGEVFQGGPEASALCVGAGEYTLIPFYAGASSASAQLSVTASGIQAVTGPPNPTLIPGPTFSLSGGSMQRGDGGFELRLRERERAELAGKVAGGGARRDVLSDITTPEVRISLLRTK